jgi:beta-glucosidase
LGTVLNLQPVYPGSDEDNAIEAAQRFDAVWNRACLEPLFKGRYPDELGALLEPYVQTEDLKQIQQPLDFLGLNFYTRFLIKADAKSPFGLQQAAVPDGAKATAMGWEVYPEGLYEQLQDLKANYGNPSVYITENGAAFADSMQAEGVFDSARIDYLTAHLEQVHRAIQAGSKVRGYFVWSLLDNFEWHEGYQKRFGLVYMDYANQKRIPKSSYYWYQQVIREASF